MPLHQHLKRLERVWVEDPVVFITTCTHNRQPLLVNERIASILIEEWAGALQRHGWMIGPYVIMPDHVHFFCAPSREVPRIRIKTLSGFMQQWKQWSSKRIKRDSCSPDRRSGLQIQPFGLQPPIWQAEFFDHILRSRESFYEKWEYMR
jgi:REP element-mobilizing transposase RayT